MSESYNDAITCRICHRLIEFRHELTSYVTEYRDYRITMFMHKTCRESASDDLIEDVVAETQYDAILTDDDLDIHDC